MYVALYTYLIRICLLYVFGLYVHGIRMVYVYVCMTCIWDVCVCFMCVCPYAWCNLHVHKYGVYVYVHVHAYACCVCVSVWACKCCMPVHMCQYRCTCRCISVSVHVCMHVYKYILLNLMSIWILWFSYKIECVCNYVCWQGSIVCDLRDVNIYAIIYMSGDYFLCCRRSIWAQRWQYVRKLCGRHMNSEFIVLS